MTTPHMVNTLRGLRDDFKDTLCYVAGMGQEVAYLPDPTMLGDMYALLDSYICWIGSMQESDGRHVIARATHAAAVPPDEADIRSMLSLTGGYPALLRAICSWWLTSDPHRQLGPWRSWPSGVFNTDWPGSGRV